MISVYELDSWQAAAGFLAWTLVVYAGGFALFRSFPAAELMLRLRRRDAQRMNAVRKAQWELRTGYKFSLPLARGDEMAAKVPISEADRDANQRFLDQVVGETVAKRALGYFMGCVVCQSFWVALLLFLATNDAGRWIAEALPSAFAYAAACGLIRDRVVGGQVDSVKHAARISPLPGEECPDCGRRG